MPLTITFPENLPVSARRHEIMAAIEQHQVVIVCGETGSGKTTQLPKMALALGRGRANAPAGARGKLIGHTQPRRIAASSVAKRIAQELNTAPGEVVGYKVRFADTLHKGASVKLMTDGILLAETQGDPLLSQYDTLIIDEAHERSLNIDFLLGYLKQLLPRRPDLKVIVTSATIDAERFAQHFASSQGPAPVIMVSGRTYPVEVRWRPFEDKRDFDLNDAIADGVDELWAGGGTGGPSGSGGDILIFLPGEREIREAADHLRKHLQHAPVLRNAEVLPLFSRLSQAEQERIFEPHGSRRIVLATNVAETSLTVPGIRYVIDAGTARVKRYSFRSKVEQLLVEPISQAAANQRAGRCGRVADGICIRLYDEAGFLQRDRFTDPEILRSSLAGVILRMKALGLGDVVNFPFLQAPGGRAIADGYQLLQELGAVDERGQLLPMGRELSRLPLDPRVGRMILEARQRGALAEVLVVAAALSVQDVRDRPLDAQQQADQQHAKFDDEKSEFSGYLRLWQWLHDARGGKAVAMSRREMAAHAASAPAAPRNMAVLPVARRAAGGQPPSQPSPKGGRRQIPPPPLGEGRGGGQSRAQGSHPGQSPQDEVGDTHKLSNRQWEQLLRSNFINIRRVREWRDIHSQLLTVVREHQWPLNPEPAGYEALHLSMLAGLLGNIGFKPEEADTYLGAHGIKFHPHPGAHLSKKPGRWIVAAEQVETTRLYGRGIAAIEPQWLEQVGGHLLKKQLLEPHWSKKQADVVALERATLYGLVVYGGRRVSYGRIDPHEARQIFIRQALVEGEWDAPWPFLAANRKLVARVEELEHKSRRQDVLVDDELIYAYYDQQLPQEVFSGATFDKWFRAASAGEPQLLRLSRDELMRHEAAGITTDNFPRTVKLGGVDCSAAYLHAPGDARDGITVSVPLFVLNQASEERAEWLVPGMLKDKIQALLKSLPQRPRSRFVPLPESAARLAQHFTQPGHWARGSLLEALLKAARDETSLDIKRSDFKPDMLSAHLFMNFRVTDEHGRQLGQGRNLAALKAELGAQARGAFQALASIKIANNQANTPAEAEKPSKRPAPPRSEGQGAGPTTPPPVQAQARHTDWSFGELPELMELARGSQVLVGFPALIDQGDAVTIEVFDEPEVAAARHRAGLRRLFALQVRDALKYLEKNIPGLTAMGVAYMPLGTLEDLRGQIIDVALERAFMAEPLPTDRAQFQQRVQEGRSRLTLIAGEVARLAATVLQEYAGAQRKLKDSKNAREAAQDAAQQLQRLVPRDFLAATPWAQLQHFPRYLKAITVRLDKWRADPARDAQRTKELQPLEQRYVRLLAERRGQVDSRMQEYRWMLEELRVSLFAQELRTPYPVSAKRLDKVWAQLVA